MKCSNCQTQMIIDKNGMLKCPNCSNTDKYIKLQQIVFNDFVFYKVVETKNILLDKYLLEEDVKELIKQGLSVEIKGGI